MSVKCGQITTLSVCITAAVVSLQIFLFVEVNFRLNINSYKSLLKSFIGSIHLPYYQYFVKFQLHHFLFDADYFFNKQTYGIISTETKTQLVNILLLLLL